MGDELRPVQAGEPLVIRASTWNRILAATRKSERGAHDIRRPPALRRPVYGVVMAYNASGEDAPWRGRLELASRENTQAQVEFVKPGGANGCGEYGVLIEAIPAGGIGRIAVAGGPWEVLCASADVGDEIGAVDGSWIAGAGTGLVVIRESIEGVAVAFFSRGAVDLMYPANFRLIEVVGTNTNVFLGETYNGAAWAAYSHTVGAWKFDEPVDVPGGSELCAWSGGMTPVQIQYQPLGGGECATLTGTATCKVILEDFDLDTIDLPGLEALEAQDTSNIMAGTLNAKAAATSTVSAYLEPGPWNFQAVGAYEVGATAYGFALVPDTIASAGSPSASDARRFRAATVESAHAICCSLARLTGGSPISR